MPQIPQLKTHAEAIKYFIEQMDAQMVDAFLDDDKKYQDIDKPFFISELYRVFDEFAKAGDTQLFAIDGHCGGCDVTKCGYKFVGNKSKTHINVIVDVENNRVKDLRDCPSFKVNRHKFSLGKQIYFNENNSIPF